MGSPREVVEAVYAAFARGDLPGVLACLDERVDWRFPGAPAVPYGGRYVGIDAVAQFFQILLDHVEFPRFETRDFAVEGDTVLVRGGETGRIKASGALFENDWAMVWTVHNGKIAALQSYEDTAAIVAAFRAAKPKGDE